MNHIFGEFIGSFMDVYLDDIIIREKLYLSEKKLQFLCDEVKILGRVVMEGAYQQDAMQGIHRLGWLSG